MGILVSISLLLLGTACGSNEKSSATVQTASTTVANQSATFTVTGLECCPPSVIQDSISKVNGVSKVEIETKGNIAKVTVSFDDLKTDVKLIQSSVTKYGFDVIGG